MTQFQKGQDVEVNIPFTGKLRPTVGGVDIWRSAKIIAMGGGIQSRLKPGDCEVEFADGSRDVFAETHVRLVPSQQ